MAQGRPRPSKHCNKSVHMYYKSVHMYYDKSTHMYYDKSTRMYYDKSRHMYYVFKIVLMSQTELKSDRSKHKVYTKLSKVYNMTNPV